MLERWLREPHIAEWWGDDVLASLEEIIEAAESIDTEPLIVEVDDHPIAYLQIHDPHLEDGHPYQDQPFGTLGIDMMIGDAALLGQGHGSAMLSDISERLLAEGAPRVIIDPHPENLRSIRACEKAGFTEIDRRASIFGEVVIMAKIADESGQAIPDPVAG